MSSNEQCRLEENDIQRLDKFSTPLLTPLMSINRAVTTVTACYYFTGIKHVTGLTLKDSCALRLATFILAFQN